MKTVVIYTSTTGFTKKYAEWIAQDLGADLVEARNLRPETLQGYDTVIYGGSLHAVGIRGIQALKKNFARLDGKRVIVFATGATPARADVPEEVINANFSPEERERIRFFYLRGGFDYSKLGLADRLLMSLLKLKIKGKKEKTPDEKGMLSAYSRPVDFTKKEYIKNLVAYAKGTKDAEVPEYAEGLEAKP
jgi:menaquinone-dependent protoporphyrinogen IX oxidase